MLVAFYSQQGNGCAQKAQTSVVGIMRIHAHAVALLQKTVYSGIAVPCILHQHVVMYTLRGTEPAMRSVHL